MLRLLQPPGNGGSWPGFEPSPRGQEVRGAARVAPGLRGGGGGGGCPTVPCPAPLPIPTGLSRTHRQPDIPQRPGLEPPRSPNPRARVARVARGSVQRLNFTKGRFKVVWGEMGQRSAAGC